MNASAAAWSLTSKLPTDKFNSNVNPVFFGATFGTDPSLYDVLSYNGRGNPYIGAPTPGTSGYPLNAFNATGAFLTDQLTGYFYSLDVMNNGNGSTDACPVDQHGNLK